MRDIHSKKDLINSLESYIECLERDRNLHDKKDIQYQILQNVISSLEEIIEGMRI